ncbi:hypothetical protein HFP05_13985 [Rhodanobacter denitrificans]|nr:hypothetical protein [Rhodanobacter denitrificans]
MHDLAPPVDAVVVLRDGTRVHVWPNESDDPECFTGQAIVDGTSAWHAVHGCSCRWLRASIVRIEPVNAQEVSHA